MKSIGFADAVLGAISIIAVVLFFLSFGTGFATSTPYIFIGMAIGWAVALSFKSLHTVLKGIFAGFFFLLVMIGGIAIYRSGQPLTEGQFLALSLGAALSLGLTLRFFLDEDSDHKSEHG